MTPTEFEKIITTLESNDTMDYTGYYNGYKLLHKKDLDNLIPEIILCSGNRTAGKTFFWKRFLVRFCLYTHTRFLIIFRKRPQVKSGCMAFYEDIQECKDFEQEFKVDTSDIAGVTSIYYGDTEIGLATYFNFADSLKEASNLFNSVSIIFKDEFQSMTGDYVDEELAKLRSIHKSVARKFGEKTRFVPTILCSNQISMVNPYYIGLGIHKRLQKETRFLRGIGWVLEICLNKEASRMAKESAFERAFGEDEYSLSDNQNVFLDNMNFVQKMSTGGMSLELVFYHKGQPYGMWRDIRYYYVSHKFDPNCKHKYATDLKSHQNGTYLVTKGNEIIKYFKRYFDNGYFRFEDIACRVALIEFFGIACL